MTRLLVSLRPFILAVLLLMLPVRRSMAEDRVDFTLGYYLEDHHRVEVYSPSLLLETDVNPTTVMRLQSTYDVVSGASPTGAPLTRLTRAEQRQVTSTQSGIGIIGYHATAGPTPHTPGPTVPIYGPVSSATKIMQTVQVPFGKSFLPMQTFTDQRLGLDLEFDHHDGDWIYSGGVAYGHERDYESVAGTAKISREFNHKATVLSLGTALGHDWVLDPTVHKYVGKDTFDNILSVSQVINTKTLLTLSGTLGTAWGYLDDQYKYASVNDIIVHENRPDARDRRIAMAVLNHAFDSVHGSLEGSYRFYNDSYGIDAHTFGLTWYQHLGRYLILAPDVRYYEQSAADFYAVKFTGNPTLFSSDYRLSNMATVTYGLKVIVKFSEKFNFSVGYDRYSMWGLDGQTPQAAYPKANIVTAGFKLWY